MYIVTKHSPSYGMLYDEYIKEIGRVDDFDAAIECLRMYFFRSNQHIIELSETIDVPSCILDLAKQNIERNAEMDITVDNDGVVFVDGVGPEMDYFMIKDEL